MKAEEFELEILGKKIKFSFPHWAERANGSVLVQLGETMVLATVVMGQERPDLDFFPLTVEYEERYYAAGKILGSRFIRRESRPSDEAILTARLIDRAVRPLFPKALKREVQIILTCFSWDKENDPDIAGLLGASLALAVSDIPWQGPIAALRIGQIENNFLLNPTYKQREKSELDLVFSVIREKGEILVNMIEAEALEKKEEVFLKAFEFAKPFLSQLLDFQEKIIMKLGKEKIELVEEEKDQQLEKELREFLADSLEKVLSQNGEEINRLKKEATLFIQKKYPGKEGYLDAFLERELERILTEKIIEKKERPDGRALDQLRPIFCQAGILTRVHGSGFFSRGKTKTLSILTLGGPHDAKLMEGMEIVGKKRFLHHYNFPPYCSGEVKPLRGPGRREIGHGMLVEKALLPLIPDFEEFPYVMRIVSEVLSSNGSTSMASVCSSSLALMDAGLPIKRAVAGISLGLFKKGDQYQILTDIQGPEDQLGDMDLKIAGSKEGITAIQMDVKISGLNEKILEEALEKGRKARKEILEEMEKVLKGPRESLSPLAPRVLTLKINPEKIGQVIGSGGRVINEIIEECGVSIDIEETGKVYVTAEKEEAAKKAIAWIKNITREVKVGQVFEGKIKRIFDFGMMVEIFPGQEGLLHISQIRPFEQKVEKIFKTGDLIKVKVFSIDEQGRINLTLKKSPFKKKYARY